MTEIHTKKKEIFQNFNILSPFYISMSDTSALLTGTITVIIKDSTGKEL
ncbi:MAG: hypothetical protein LBG59_00530 [Candidatus Peribacteria bacterium]|nr:hypothetical protein [Candidatus Peribacteria bacterium]